MSVIEIDLTMASNSTDMQIDAQLKALELFHDIINIYADAGLNELALGLKPLIDNRILSLKKEMDYFLPICEVKNA